jgi:basic amino acid/polyamine antiporter, APA family
VLIAAVISLAKTWSAMAWIASRLLFAQARHGFLPRVFAEVEPRSGAPRLAVVFVTAATLVGLLLGRGAILPIVDMVSICSALSMILCIIVLLRRRRMDAQNAVAQPNFTVPGGKLVILVALVSAIIMISLALIQPLLRGAKTVPLEWVLMGAWGAIGIVVWSSTHRLRERSAQGYSRLSND